MTESSLEHVTVVIPAAGPPPQGVVGLSNVTCPAMVPVGGRPVIHWTLRYLISLGLRRFIVAVSERGLFVEDFVECTFGRDATVEFIVPSRDAGPGWTLHELLEGVQTRSALAVLGDTHFQFADPTVLAGSDAFVLTGPVEDAHRWCTAEADEGGLLTALHDKEPREGGPHDALIGVYFFPEVEPARKSARAAVDASPQRAEISAILEGIGAIRVHPSGDWLDVGNADRRASSHRTLLQKRDFNDLDIDPVFGTITKRSRHLAKFIDEINYLRLLPPELSVLYPRVLSFSTDWDDAFLEMEYYGYPSLSEVFVFENVDPAAWERVFEHLYELITRGFMRFSRPLAPDCLDEMLLEKTRQRVDALGDHPARRLLTEGVHVDGRQLPGLDRIWPEIISRVAAMSSNGRGSIIHGDLCLSNVLYDLRARIVKLVDPRGSFGAAGIHGDPRYDVAKLYHSVFGQYDFIVNDLFTVEVEGGRARLELRTRPYHRQVLERFERVFFPGFDRAEILLITGLLFASMPALHYDTPRRQLAMAIRALQLLDEAGVGS